MQELVEVRLNAVLVLAQRHADVFRLYGIVQGALLLFELCETFRHRIADHILRVMSIFQSIQRKPVQILINPRIQSCECLRIPISGPFNQL